MRLIGFEGELGVDTTNDQDAVFHLHLAYCIRSQAIV
jgi:hypothetical protein